MNNFDKNTYVNSVDNTENDDSLPGLIVPPSLLFSNSPG